MTSAIVVGTTGWDSPWLHELGLSLVGVEWPVVVHVTRDWELATIGWAAGHFQEFVFLPQSTVVLDPAVFDRCFRECAGSSVDLGTAQGKRFQMYLGKYRSEAVLAGGVPVVADKRAAVAYELTWCAEYAARESRQLVSVGSPLEHTEVFEDRHGRRNMVVENEYLRRYKSCWDGASLELAIGAVG